MQCSVCLLNGGEPLHYKEIATRALERGLWTTAARRPDVTVNARLGVSSRSLRHRHPVMVSPMSESGRETA